MKTRKNFTLSGLFFIILMISFTLSSCVNSSKDGSKKETQEKSKSIVSDLDNDVSEFVYPLPSAYEVTELLNNIGIGYMLGMSNSVENVSRYFTAKSKAYNMGIYATDLSYASTYKMTQETMLYLEALNQLGSDLGISSIYNEDLLKSIESNVNNKDSLIEIISITINETYDYLNKNGKGDLSILMVAGGWIEGMYLTTNVSENYQNNPEIVKVIYAQKPSLVSLLKIADERKENSEIQELIDDLQPIKKAYDDVTNANLTDDQIRAIASAVETLRTKHIS
ncbi:MAG: hypothetical protein DRI95_14045 [Bacteroidetes bacterium]|nr:MAG: hypothetical protein DRI95_14045 [Bacteroidota bacterium]